MARVRRFDAVALHAALDARRQELGLSWKQLADDVWAQSAELNARRPGDHPLAVTTFTGMAKRGAVGAPHALFMLRWLGQPPEAFLGYEGTLPAACALPDPGPERRLRWNLKRLYVELDEQRRAEAMSWAQLAKLLGCTPNQLTGIRTAKFGLGTDVAMAITQWLRKPAAHFIDAAGW
ncbi:MAG TPA: hypothetical protein VHV75_03705 [Solirubrobacteraceae bacterium]|jgi:hypothetical protein|nr:hypothetical protein [Solirubrobacteraceae bacterium]